MRALSQSYNKHFQAGFTLLEVLIALLIVAVTVTVPILAFKDNDGAKLKNKSYQLAGLLQLAQEESIFRGVEIGLRVEHDEYYFMLYDGNKWQPLQEHKLLKKIDLQEPIEIYVHVEGQETLLTNSEPEDDDKQGEVLTEEEQAEQNIEQAKKSVVPQIYMLSSGEMNEFVLTLGLDRDDAIFYRITGDYLGDLSLSKELEGHYQHDWDLDLEPSN